MLSISAELFLHTDIIFNSSGKKWLRIVIVDLRNQFVEKSGALNSEKRKYYNYSETALWRKIEDCVLA